MHARANAVIHMHAAHLDRGRCMLLHGSCQDVGRQEIEARDSSLMRVCVRESRDCYKEGTLLFLVATTTLRLIR